MQIRQHADYRLAGILLQPVQPGLQQCNIAPKTINDKALHPCLLGFAQQSQRAHQMREHTAAVDIRNQYHRKLLSVRRIPADYAK